MSESKQRELQFDSINEVIAEVERLAASEVETKGNYSFGEILEHLARTFDVVCGQVTGPKASLPMRIMGRLMRPILLRGPMKPGFRLPSGAQSFFWPTEQVDFQTSLDHFRESYQRFKDVDTFGPHPFFGRMSRQQQHRLACLHCALHLSFVHPVP